MAKKMNKERINFDDLTEEQAGKLFPIRIEPYNPDWKMLFGQEKSLIAGVLGDNVALNVEHFGSTSVEGLAAKPTIDIMVEVSKFSSGLKQFIIEKLETIGYGNMYNAEKEDKMTFGKGYNENCNSTQTYHVHIREMRNTPQEEILFRDFLRQNTGTCNEYAKLKYELAEKYRYNRENYMRAKTEFIARITEQLKKKGRGSSED